MGTKNNAVMKDPVKPQLNQTKKTIGFDTIEINLVTFILGK